VVAHGATVKVSVSIDRPASPGGLVVALSSTGAGALSVPANVTIAAGATSASFDVTGVSMGGPYNLGASVPGALLLASVRVTPALTSMVTNDGELTVGGNASFTLSLEAATPVALEVALASGTSAVATVPTKLTIPAGASSASFEVDAVGLGGALLTASLGGQKLDKSTRVLGVYLSEILYDVTSNDTNLEWIELYNATGESIDLDGAEIQSAGGADGPGFVTTLVLAGTLAPHQCAVVGGPSNSGVTFFQGMDLSPDLGNASSGKADGVQLVGVGGAVVDNVIYGASNVENVLDENGNPSAPDVGAAPINQTIERSEPGLAGAWRVQATPSPGNCTPIAP
jgi:hypothetical protein